MGGVGKENPDHIMLWAACCTCYFGFLRSGEITVPSHAQYKNGAHLSAGDVTVDRANNPSIVRVHIKASKTGPFRKGVFVFVGRTDNRLCPVAAITAYMALRGHMERALSLSLPMVRLYQGSVWFKGYAKPWNWQGLMQENTLAIVFELVQRLRLL